jgi:sialate O-acetylesterase
VGHRLALQALRKVYGQRGVIADGPAYRRCERTGNALRVFFDGAENGLELRGGDMGAFEVAGEDGAFVRASAVSGTGAHGKGTLLVSSPEVPEPCAVRYAWKAYCGVPLYGADGLPAPPFLGSV